MSYFLHTVPRHLLRSLAAWSLVCGIASAQTPNEDLPQFTEVREKYGLMGRGQTVAVIDSGIAYDHVAFGAGLGPSFRVVGGYDFTRDSDSDPYDDAGPLGGHGTKVASLVAGAVGDTDLVGLRVFEATGESYLTWVEQALKWVHDNRNSFANPITAVNLSLGIAGNSSVSLPGSVIEDELAQLKADGIFIAASAGNDFTTFGVPGLAYPASSPHVVAAMSVDDDGQLSYFSQRLPRAIAAPGRELTVAVPDYLGDKNGVANDYAVENGTDLSAPILASASVIVREMFAFNGNASATQQTIYDHLRQTADTLYDAETEQEYQRLNLVNAIDALVPIDDFGSTLATASQLGTINSTISRNGTVSTSADLDFFSFIAGQSGLARLQSTATHYLAPEWTIYDSNGVPITTQSAADFTFNVAAGVRYSMSLGTDEGIGHFTASLTIGAGSSPLLGDYDMDNIVDASDYTIWRSTMGSTTDFRADGNKDGRVDSADYNIWKQNFGQKNLTGAAASIVPESPTLIMFVALLMSSAIRRRQVLSATRRRF